VGGPAPCSGHRAGNPVRFVSNSRARVHPLAQTAEIDVMHQRCDLPQPAKALSLLPNHPGNSVFAEPPHPCLRRIQGRNARAPGRKRDPELPVAGRQISCTILIKHACIGEPEYFELPARRGVKRAKRGGILSFSKYKPVPKGRRGCDKQGRGQSGDERAGRPLPSQ